MLDFYKGMDISFLPEYLDKGMCIRDFDNTPTEALSLVAKYGVNALRLRIWNQPENVPESLGYCSLSHTLALGRKIKEMDMNFLLDFHYSDYWADPAKQNKPKAWEHLSFVELENAVYEYTRDVLLSLKKGDAMPDMVQIGNEIRSGLLFPDGELPDYSSMVRLVNAGIRGARAVGGQELLIMIHLDQGGRYFYLKEWFDQAIKHGLLDFDLIGLSYYPFWHGTFTDLKETLMHLVTDYKKPIILAETAHAWRKSAHGFIDEAQEKIAGIDATPEGQKKVLDLVMNIMASLPDKMGRGIYYWEPLCIPEEEQGGWAENMGLLDENGKVMDGIKSFLFTREQYTPSAVAKIYQPDKMIVVQGNVPKLPTEVSALYYDGSIKKHRVTWNTNFGEMKTGTYRLTGKATDIEAEITLQITIIDQLPAVSNLVHDPNWDDGLTRWNLDYSKEGVMVQLCPEFIQPFPAPPQNAIRIEAVKNFHFTISQQITLYEAGTYHFQVEYKGTDTTNVNISLFLESLSEQADASFSETVIHPTEHEWQEYKTTLHMMKQGVVQVGIRITSPPVYGMFKQFKLYKESEQINENNIQLQ
ncbi:glycosyl hydrolase 53 family protein [Lachnospiraceae bacterium OttesenSCG-928-D06]|nr:glycosyl hydrolase 53 family protein [Lachnospiraceae bacterium OttesenSCG-928-D06]